MKRRSLLASAGVTALLLTTGCGVSAEKETKKTTTTNASPSKLEGEITFQTWSLKNEKFTPYFEKLVKDFEAKNPGTKINWIDQPGDGYEDKVLQQANSSTLPDVVNLPPEFAYQLAKAKKLVDLKAADPNVEKTYVAGGLKAYTFDGIEGTFGVPWYLGTDMNYFNEKLITDAGLTVPTDWKSMVETAKKLAEKTGGKTPLISNMPGMDSFRAAGVQVFTDGKFTFNKPEAVAVLQEYVDLYKAKAMPPEVLQNNYTGNAILYKQAKVAWTTGTASTITDLKKDAPTLVPATKISGRFGTPPLFVQGLSVSADSKAPALALAFCQFVANNANQVEFVKLAQGFMPGTQEANEKPEQFTTAITDPLMVEAVKIAAAQMPKAEQLNPVQFNTDMNKYLGQQMALAMRGDITAQAALDKAAEYCNKKLA